MANIEAALSVLATHLVAAGAALTVPFDDVDRGLPTGGRQLRYYWAGEVDPPRFDNRVLTGDLVGERFSIIATWQLTNLLPDTVTTVDIEMLALAGQIRTRIDGDSQLGGNVEDLELGYATPDLVVIANARHIACRWNLDVSYVEYAVAP